MFCIFIYMFSINIISVIVLIFFCINFKCVFNCGSRNISNFQNWFGLSRSLAAPVLVHPNHSDLLTLVSVNTHHSPVLSQNLFSSPTDGADKSTDKMVSARELPISCKMAEAVSTTFNCCNGLIL